MTFYIMLICQRISRKISKQIFGKTAGYSQSGKQYRAGGGNRGESHLTETL